MTVTRAGRVLNKEKSPVFARSAKRPAKGPEQDEPTADQDLIASFRAGERTAAESLARRYYGKVLGVCLRYLRCPVEAQDIAQDVFMKVLGERKILQFRGQAQLWTWLYKVTINACKSELVRRVRRCRRELAVLQDEEAVLHHATVAAETEHAAAWNQRREVLHQAIRELPQRYREVIRMIYLEKCSRAEVALRLRIASGTVGVQVMRGKLLLAKLSRSLLARHDLN